MRTMFCVLLVLIATAIGAAFYFGLCMIVAEREERTYVLRVVIYADFMVPKPIDESRRDTADEFSLETRGKIVRVNAAKSELVLTENFKNMTFRVSNDTMLLVNGQAAKLTDLNGGDEATVVYTKQGQQLNANVFRCTRKQSVQ